MNFSCSNSKRIKIVALATKRLHLQPLALQHANNIFDTINKYRDSMRQWLPFVDFTHSVEDSRAYVQYTIDSVFAVFYGDNFAGLVGLKDYDEVENCAEIGYWISPAEQNKGIATEACSAVVKYAFETLKLNLLRIRVAVANEKSLRVVSKLGFDFKDIEKNGELLCNGYTDLKIFTLSKEKFFKN